MIKGKDTWPLHFHLFKEQSCLLSNDCHSQGTQSDDNICRSMKLCYLYFIKYSYLSLIECLSRNVMAREEFIKIFLKVVTPLFSEATFLTILQLALSLPTYCAPPVEPGADLGMNLLTFMHLPIYCLLGL